MKSAAISAALSLVMAFGEFCSPASKLEPLFPADGTHKDRQWTVRNVIERLAAIRRDKIVLGDVEFENLNLTSKRSSIISKCA